MESEIGILDVLNSMLETDRAFYQTLRFLNENRTEHLTAHQRNDAAIMLILRIYAASQSRSNVTYTATIPLNLPTGWNEPVVVRPTPAQIAAATTPIEIRDCTCAICQEEIDGNGMRLRHCQHTFHDNCIAEWFTRSVHCPNCRHDIRSADHPAPTSSVPAGGQPPENNRWAGWLGAASPSFHTEDIGESDEHHA